MDATNAVSDGAKIAGGFVYDSSAASVQFVSGKLEETGVADKAKNASEYVYNSGTAGLEYVNSTIESNPTMASVKSTAA